MESEKNQQEREFDVASVEQGTDQNQLDPSRRFAPQDETEGTNQDETEVNHPEKGAQATVSKDESLEEESCAQQLMRVNADFANYRRRMEKERVVWNSAGQEKVLKALIGVIDDLDRAITSGKTGEKPQLDTAWFDGLLLIQKNIGKQLETLGVRTIDCSNGFDPELHEALAHVDSPDHETGHIVEVIKPGYKLHDTVIVHAQVCVAK